MTKDNSQNYGVGIQLNAKGKAPKSIQLLPRGDVIGRDGRQWLNSLPEDIIAAFHRHEGPIGIDYEHSFDLAENGPTPAAGWIDQMEIKDGEIWGTVSWTPKAKEYVENEEYKFISPSIYFNKHSGVVTEIFGAGLTNRPNLALKALNKSQPNPQKMENTMDKQTRIALCKTLGLANEASDVSILQAVEGLDNDKAAALNRASTPDAKKFVPIADYTLVKGDLDKALNTIEEQSTQTADVAIDAAIKAGKVAPSSKDYHLNACKTKDGLAAFNKMVEASASISSASAGDDLGGNPDQKQKALNSQQRGILGGLGIDLDDEKAVAEALKEIGE